MIQSEAIHTRPSGLRFTHIHISPIVRGREYVATFSFCYGTAAMMEVRIYGNSPLECVRKTSLFLRTTLEHSEWTFESKSKTTNDE